MNFGLPHLWFLVTSGRKDAPDTWSPDLATMALVFVAPCTLLTLLSCLYILARLLSGHPSMRRKLLARQLTWLAAADIVVACCSVYGVLSSGGYILFDNETGQIVARIMQAIWGFSEFNSILLELHLSLGVAFSWRRSLWSLQVLDWTLVLVPLFSTVSTILLVFLEPLHYYRDGQRSVVVGTTMVVELVLLTLTFISCFFAYASALWATSRGNFAGERGVQTRLWMYPANFIISYTCQYATGVNGTLRGTWVGVFAKVGLAMSGFLNSSTYFLHHRWSKSSLFQRGHVVDASKSPRVADIASFHAIFDTHLVSVVELHTPSGTVSFKRSSSSEATGSSGPQPFADNRHA